MLYGFVAIDVARYREDFGGKLPTFSFPGAYPMVYATADDRIICPDCASDPGDGVTVVGAAVHEEGPAIQCEECGALIESAYGETD